MRYAIIYPMFRGTTYINAHTLYANKEGDPIMKYCPSCNQTNDDATAFCFACGTPLGQENAPPPQQQGYAPPPPQGYAPPPQGYAQPPQPYPPPQQQGYAPPPPQGQYNNGYTGVRRSGISVILLSIITCGIYMYWWYYQTMEDINKASGEQRINSSGLLIFSIFCPPVAYYMMYTIDKNLSRLSQENGTFYKENFMFWLLMTILCGIGSLIAIFQICTAFNEIWDRRDGAQQFRY